MNINPLGNREVVEFLQKPIEELKSVGNLQDFFNKNIHELVSIFEEKTTLFQKNPDLHKGEIEKLVWIGETILTGEVHAGNQKGECMQLLQKACKNLSSIQNANALKTKSVTHRFSTQESQVQDVFTSRHTKDHIEKQEVSQEAHLYLKPDHKLLFQEASPQEFWGLWAQFNGGYLRCVPGEYEPFLDGPYQNVLFSSPGNLRSVEEILQLQEIPQSTLNNLFIGAGKYIQSTLTYATRCLNAPMESMYALGKYQIKQFGYSYGVHSLYEQLLSLLSSGDWKYASLPSADSALSDFANSSQYVFLKEVYDALFNSSETDVLLEIDKILQETPGNETFSASQSLRLYVLKNQPHKLQTQNISADLLDRFRQILADDEGAIAKAEVAQQTNMESFTNFCLNVRNMLSDSAHDTYEAMQEHPYTATAIAFSTLMIGMGGYYSYKKMMEQQSLGDRLQLIQSQILDNERLPSFYLSDPHADFFGIEAQDFWPTYEKLSQNQMDKKSLSPPLERIFFQDNTLRTPQQICNLESIPKSIGEQLESAASYASNCAVELATNSAKSFLFSSFEKTLVHYLLHPQDVLSTRAQIQGFCNGFVSQIQDIFKDYSNAHQLYLDLGGTFAKNTGHKEHAEKMAAFFTQVLEGKQEGVSQEHKHTLEKLVHMRGSIEQIASRLSLFHLQQEDATIMVQCVAKETFASAQYFIQQNPVLTALATTFIATSLTIWKLSSHAEETTKTYQKASAIFDQLRKNQPQLHSSATRTVEK